MTIFNQKYRIAFDGVQFIVQRRRTEDEVSEATRKRLASRNRKPIENKWVNVGYFSKPLPALERLRDYQMGDLAEDETLATEKLIELLKELQECDRRLFDESC